MVAAWALACGGTPDRRVTEAPPDAGRSDAGTSAGPDAGTGLDGDADAGTSDAGSSGAGTSDAGISDAGASDAGAFDAGTSDAGASDAGTTDAGTPDAGTSDAGTSPGLDAGTLDGGTDDSGDDAGTPGGGEDADCEGLMPGALPTPASARLAGSQEGSGDGYFCLDGTSDGEGSVVLGSQNEMQPHDTQLHFFSSAGAALGAYVSAGYAPIPQLSGYVGLEIYGGNYEHDVLALAPDGSVRRRWGDERRAGSAAEDPFGGMIVWSAQTFSATGDLQSFDANGNLRWSVSLTLQNFFESIGVDREGNILLLSRHGSLDLTDGLDGQWVSHDGVPVGGDFAAVRIGDFRPSEFTLFPRVGSGLFLRKIGVNGAEWIRAFPALQGGGEAVPSWLAARAAETFHLIRGGRAYGFLPPPNQSATPCAQRIDLVTQSGHACGAVELPISNDTCTTGSVSIGYDGTVLQRLPSDASSCSAGGECSCDWRWWSKILG